MSVESSDKEVFKDGILFSKEKPSMDVELGVGESDLGGIIGISLSFLIGINIRLNLNAIKTSNNPW